MGERANKMIRCIRYYMIKRKRQTSKSLQGEILRDQIPNWLDRNSNVNF